LKIIFKIGGLTTLKGWEMGQIEAWDYQWTYSLWREGQVSIIPSQNLVVNIGFDADATHTISPDFLGANLSYGSLKPPYVFPPTRAVAVDLDRKVLESHVKIQKPKPETFTKKNQTRD
jgi:hypothetical protein